jgi:hypothetical protein
MGLIIWISITRDTIVRRIGAIHMFRQKRQCRPQESVFGPISLSILIQYIGGYSKARNVSGRSRIHAMDATMIADGGRQAVLGMIGAESRTLEARLAQ